MLDKAVGQSRWIKMIWVVCSADGQEVYYASTLQELHGSLMDHTQCQWMI